MARLSYGVLGVLLFAWPGLGRAAEPSGKPVALFFQSADRKIKVDRYPPASVKPKGTVIVMHGAGGILFDGPEMRRVARDLAAAGETVYLLHYFNRTGTIAVERISVMQGHFEEWLQTVRDGIAWVQAREGEKAAPVGLYGYSLGAFLAVAAASDNPRVGAVAEQAGGMWNSEEKRVDRMPPVFMIHGRADRRVPFGQYAEPLLRVLHARGGAVETDFVDGEGHVFSHPAMAVVRPKVVAYFERRLR